jgi:hypothetical protein
LLVAAVARVPAWRDLTRVMKTVGMGTAQPQHGRWPEHLPAGALRVVRWSARYDETVIFYRDGIGLPVLETFQDSYGLDGTILGLPGSPVHLEIVRLENGQHPAPGLDQLVFYLPDAAARARITARLAAAGVEPIAQIDYWEDNGGVTYQDPDGREVVFASWIYREPEP